MPDIGNINEHPERVYPMEHHIDATPDGQYAIRILKYYRELSNVSLKIFHMSSSLSL